MTSSAEGPLRQAAGYKWPANTKEIKSMSQSLIGNFILKPAIIAINGSVSGAVDILGLMLLGCKMPAAWTAASLTFQGSVDGGESYQSLYDEDGSEIAWTGATVDRILFQAGAQPIIAGLTHLKVRSGVAALPVAQAAAASIVLILDMPNP
jgi:hypothetical protein